jgi:hypothetical protein
MKASYRAGRQSAGDAIQRLREDAGPASVPASRRTRVPSSRIETTRAGTPKFATSSPTAGVQSAEPLRAGIVRIDAMGEASFASVAFVLVAFVMVS